MKVPISWLKEYVKIPDDISVLTAKLTAVGHMQDHPPENIAGDTVLDLEIRQNRPDCLSVIGLARETSAVLDTELTLPKSLDSILPPVSNNLNITNESQSLCYRFNTMSFEGIKIKSSPAWLAKKLEAYGIKSINNLIDITNFVMLELGQPLHVFNKKAFLHNHIFIRNARDNESIIVLGNREVRLIRDNLVIANENELLAIAGIIGGLQKTIDSETTEIVLEAATYNQASIRRTSLKYDLRTEASLRHEKFLSPKLTEVALKRANELIIELCEGTCVDRSDYYPNVVTDKKVLFNTSVIEKLGGVKIDIDEIDRIFRKLGISVTKISDLTYEATIPFFRTDIEQEADLVEEVLRIYGYDRIPERLLTRPSPKDIQSKPYLLEEGIREILIAFGFDEEINEPLTKEEKSVHKPIILQNSLNSEKVMLRTTLSNNLHQAALRKRKYRRKDVFLFELGKIYYMDDEKYTEERVLGGIGSSVSTTYLNIKGYLEVLMERLGYSYTEHLVHIERIEDQVPTYYFQISVDRLMNLKRDVMPTVWTTPPQIIFEDLSIIVPIDTKVGDLISVVKSTSSIVYKIELGEQPIVQNNMKTVFLKLSYHSPDARISAEDTNPIRDKILNVIKLKFNASLRK